MTTVTTSKGVWRFVPIHNDANNFFMGGECPSCLSAGIWNCAHADTCGNSYPALKVSKDDTFLMSIILKDAKYGQWSFIATLKGITEETAELIVNKWMTGEGNYYWWTEGMSVRFATPKAALESLMLSQGMDIKINHAIFKKV